MLIGDEKGRFRSTHVKTDIKQRFKVVRNERDVCVKILKLSEKKGMSVGGQGPALFLFVLLC